MPLFSAFTPFGALAFSGKPSRVESIYGAISRNLGGAYDLTVGGHHEASVYARARSVARAEYALERANNQYDGLTAIEMLPGLGRDYGLVPNEKDTLLARQQNVAARQAIPQGGATYLAIKNGLAALLGSAFITLRAMPTGAATLSASTPVGNFTDPTLPPKQVILPDPTPTGTWTARYANADGEAAPVTLLVGDSLVVQPGNSGLVEIVSVTAVAPGTFTATFAKGHDAGCFASTQNFPNWWSTQRSYMVVLTSAASVDSETLRKTHDYMARVCRGVTQWSVVAGSVANRAGPFTLGDLTLGRLGPVPIGVNSYTP